MEGTVSPDDKLIVTYLETVNPLVCGRGMKEFCVKAAQRLEFLAIREKKLVDELHAAHASNSHYAEVIAALRQSNQNLQNLVVDLQKQLTEAESQIPRFLSGDHGC